MQVSQRKPIQTILVLLKTQCITVVMLLGFLDNTNWMQAFQDMQASKQTHLFLITSDIKEWLCMLMLPEINHTSIQKVTEIYYIFFQQNCTIYNCKCLLVFSEGIGTLFNNDKSWQQLFPKPSLSTNCWSCECSGFQGGNPCTVSYIVNSLTKKTTFLHL